MGKGRPPRILVVEDDYLVSETIVRMLKGIHCELAGKASDGIKAVEMVCSERPDLVLMDIQMPDMDGIEAACQIQEQCPTPIVILTAFETQELVERASEAGVCAYLTKPPTVQEIERAITIALARHGDLVALRKMNTELETKNAELQAALDEIETLRGILPVCMYCKKIRDDTGYWEQVDIYIGRHTPAKISHGMCPDCMKEHFPDYS